MFAFRLPALAVVVAVALAHLPAVAVPPEDKPERLEAPLKLGGKLVLEFARIPKGIFMMGSPKSERDAIFKKYEAIVKKYKLPASFFDDEKEHEVEITRDYYMAKTAVTRPFTHSIDCTWCLSSTRLPALSMRAWHSSHICPGPSSG